jgi:NAD(P)-dependent dehydrogenase (short-subunit alcohol dehydrogenase family)
VYLAGRTQGPLDAVAGDIRAAGGTADAAVVDALDAAAVDAHADRVAAEAGRLDISFNAITHGDVQGTAMVEMDVEDYLAPVVNGVRTTFLTTKAAARHMVPRGGGVILLFGGSGDPPRGYRLGGLQTGFEALEAMRRQLAVELGPHGVRVVTLRTGGIAESIPEGFEGRERIVADFDATSLLGRGASLADVQEAAVFAASDRARSITAATINISAGALIDR